MKPKVGATQSAMRLVGVAMLLVMPLTASAQDLERVERGRLLYETYCGLCHYERVHARLHTKVKSTGELRDMVARWAPQTKHAFTPDEREAVVEYLNASHYRIGLPGRNTQIYWP